MSKFGIRVCHGTDFTSWAGTGYDTVFVFPTKLTAKYFIDQHWLQFTPAWKKAHLKVERFPDNILNVNCGETVSG